MADEVRISAFYSFKRLFSSLFFMERSGSLMKRRLGMNETAFEIILSAFYFRQTAFHQATASLHEKQ